MRFSLSFVTVGLALAAALPATPSRAAEGCRAHQIMVSQCTWFALEELRGSKAEMVKAQQEATSTLIDGCSPKEYQMVLLRGTGLSDPVVSRLRASGTRDVASVRRECGAVAGQMIGR
jgi:hypothetical protein